MSSPHVDHALASLAEAGMPLDTPVRTERRPGTLARLLEASLAGFRLNQREVEWSALAYALYLPPRDGWVTREGQEVSFDRLAERLMRPRLPDGVCSGHHRLYTLVAFLRVDEALREAGAGALLGETARAETVDFLRSATATLERTRHAAGFWNGNWPFAAPQSAAPGDGPGDSLADRLTATGHALEWWALSPPEILPEPRVVREAAAWLLATAESLDDAALLENYSYLTHAGRALALWRGSEAGDVFPSPAAPRAAP